MSVLTVYNHGTGGSSTKGYDKLEIVNIFSNLHKTFNPGGRNTDWFITEGVGSKHDPASCGPLTVDMHTGALIEGNISKSGSLMQKIHGATGSGVQDNVQRFMVLMNYLARRNQLPTMINMVGWSRGAVTCIRMAYELFYCDTFDGISIPINIFAVDPVAGGSADSEVQGSILCANVKNYFCMLAVNERRSTFAAKTADTLQVMNDDVTSVCYLNFPGIHSDVAKYSGETGIVTFHLCAKFLSTFGTIVPDHANWLSNNHKLLQCYFNMALKEKRIGTTVYQEDKKTERLIGWKNKNTSIKDRLMSKGRFEDRNIDTLRGVSDSEVFVNVHHELLFKGAYPALYNLIFNSVGMGRFQWMQAFDSPLHQPALRLLELYSPGVTELLRWPRPQHIIPSEPGWASTLQDNGMMSCELATTRPRR